MKTKIVCFLLVLGFVGNALALDAGDLDYKIRSLTDRFVEFEHTPGKSIPPATLAAAKGIMLLDRTKAGFLFAYQGGGGVAMVRNNGNGRWSPAAFVSANEASLGFQVGGEQRFVVVLMMTTNATRMLTDQKFDFAGEARGTAGSDTSGVQTQSPRPASVLVYDDRQGLYGGAAVKGGAVAPDEKANHLYYNDYYSMGDILFGHRVQRTPAADYLAQTLNQFGHAATETSSR